MKSKKIRIFCIVLLCVILFIYLSILTNSIMNGNKMGFFSLRFYIMSSDSSESNANAGDLVIAKSVNVKDIKENDDIIYQRNNRMIIKKVIRTDNENGEFNIYIENDNVLSNEKIQNAQIIGKVIYTVKGFGNIALFIQSPLGTLNIVIIAICIFIIIKKLSKGNEENKQDNTSQTGENIETNETSKTSEK